MPNSKVSEKQRDAANSMLAAIKPFRKQRETMPLQYVQAFLLVAAEEHQNVSTYATRAGTSQSLMTRHLQDLGEYNRHRQEGLGLVEAYTDMMDRRNRLIRLTAKGRHAVAEMCDAFG